MKRLFTITAILMASLCSFAQNEQRPFQAYIYNQEYEVYLHINFYEQDVNVPGQALYGSLPGYLGKERNPFCWVITSARLKDERTAELSLINDYGSEDFTALLVQENDSLYTLKHLKGSALKVPKNGRWQKLPGTIQFKRKR